MIAMIVRKENSINVTVVAAVMLVKDFLDDLLITY